MAKVLIFGKHPFFSVIKAGKRKIFSLHISHNNKDEFNSLITKENINVKGLNISWSNNSDLDRLLLQKDKNHQGYIMFAEEKEEMTLDDFIEMAKNENELPKLLILDQILDPHNLGALLRSAVAFGCFNIIITEFNSTKETSTVTKVSAGLSEFVNIIEVVNLNNAIKDLKKIGYFVYGADGEARITIEKIDGKNSALVLGNEGKGIRELVKKNCDDLIKIPMHEFAESLNVSVAGGIIMYQLWK